MWRKQSDTQPDSPAELAAAGRAGSPEPAQGQKARPGEGTRIGKTLTVRGEMTGQEDVLLEGKLEGNIRLAEARLTVGPSGQLRAEVEAQEIEVHGEVEGTLLAKERVRIGRSGKLTGDVVARRLAVEEGAVIHGTVDIVRPGESRPAKAREAAVRAGSVAPIAAGNGATTREPVN